MTPGEQVVPVLLIQYELDPLHVLRIISPQGFDQVHFIIVQGPHSLQNFPDNIKIVVKENKSPVKLEDKDVDVVLVEQNGIAFNGYTQISNADFPGRYDYYCERSKAEWGCVMSLQSVDSAMDICNQDKRCKAIVTIPHLRKEGWIIAILKSENDNPVDHSGTTVYIKGGSTLEENNSFLNMQLPVQNDNSDCLDDVIDQQLTLRDTRERAFLSFCGLGELSDEEWLSVMYDGIVDDAVAFKPARGKLANGGQMTVLLNEDRLSSSKQCMFLAKKGPEEYSTSQLAVYQLDRLLGLYKTLPTAERHLSESELKEAGFPVDVGGNVFDKFRPLKLQDGSLIGVLVPEIDQHFDTEHYLTVPKLDEITNAVTPFSKKQWMDIEYLILGYLASIPFPSKGFTSIKGKLIFLKTDTAFVHDSNEYFSYLYNCQFPSHVVDVLRAASTSKCSLKAYLTTKMPESFPPNISNMLDKNVHALLELVDTCISKFGKENVMYNS